MVDWLEAEVLAEVVMNRVLGCSKKVALGGTQILWVLICSNGYCPSEMN